MIDMIPVIHVTFESFRSFEEVVRLFEESVGSIEEIGFEALFRQATGQSNFEEKIKHVIGKSDFTRFLTVDHGEWLKLHGLSRKSIMYVIGNPLIAITMLKHDIEAGLDVPVRISIYQHVDGRTRFVFNKPSTLMSAIESSVLHAAALKLDAKLMALGELVTGTKA